MVSAQTALSELSFHGSFALGTLPRYLSQSLRALFKCHAEPATCVKLSLKKAKGEISKPLIALNDDKKPLTPFQKILKRVHLIPSEFWLGLLAGAIVRMATRFSLEVFAASMGTAQTILSHFVICSIAGLGAGIAVCMTHKKLRNQRRGSILAKEKYFDGTCGIKALTGMLAGLVGGCVSYMLISFPGLSLLIICVGAGAGIGLPYAFLTNPNMPNNDDKEAWVRWTVRCAAFGAAGGALGLLSTELSSFLDFLIPSANAAELAQNLNPASEILATAPNAFHPVSIRPSTLGQHATAHHHKHVKLHHHKHVHHRHALKKIHHALHRQYHHVHHRLAYYLRHYGHGIANYHAHVTHADPMAAYLTHTGHGIAHYGSHREAAVMQLDLHGPCADTQTACVERIVFDANGDASRVILEPAPTARLDAHFDVQTVTATDEAANMGTAATDDNAQVSLIVPFANVAKGLLTALPTI